jgi:hypothetical protein
MKQRAIVIIFSILLIALYLYAAITKLTDYYNFQFGLSESPFISQYAGILSWAIPVVEIMIAALLVWPSTRLAGFYLSFGLMSLFTLYIAAMLVSGSEIPCSCGGVLEKMSWPMHIVFNSFFVLISAAAISLERKRKRTKLVSVNLRNITYAKGHPSTTGADRLPDPH